MAIPAIAAAALPTILKTLEKWSDWDRIRGAPSRIDQLERRIEELERKLAEAQSRKGRWL